LVPKFNNLDKNVGRCKYKVVRYNYNIKQYYMSIRSQHAKHENLFYNREIDIVTKIMVMGDVVGEKKRKFKQFVAFFSLLSSHSF
jgi:hypothetical protein